MEEWALPIKTPPLPQAHRATAGMKQELGGSRASTLPGTRAHSHLG